MRKVADHVEAGWDIYKDNFVAYLLAMTLIIVVTFGIVLGGLFSLFPISDSDKLSDLLSSQSQMEAYIEGLSSGRVILAGLLFLAAAFFNIALTGGIIRFSRDLLKGKNIDVLKDMFATVRENGISLVWARIISFLILASIGVVFFGFLPGASTLSLIFAVTGLIVFIVATISFMLIEEAVVIDNTTGVKGVGKSYKVATNHFWPLFTLMLFFGLAAFVFNLVPYFGTVLNLFFLTPVMLGTYTDFYMKRKGVTRAQQKAIYRSGKAFKRTKKKANKSRKPRHTSTKSRSSKKVKRRPLTEVKGIGKATRKKLRDAGVKSTQSLVSSDPEKLSEKTGISKSRIKKWQTKAKKL